MPEKAVKVRKKTPESTSTWLQAQRAKGDAAGASTDDMGRQKPFDRGKKKKQLTGAAAYGTALSCLPSPEPFAKINGR